MGACSGHSSHRRMVTLGEKEAGEHTRDSSWIFIFHHDTEETDVSMDVPFEVTSTSPISPLMFLSLINIKKKQFQITHHSPLKSSRSSTVRDSQLWNKQIPIKATMQGFRRTSRTKTQKARAPMCPNRKPHVVSGRGEQGVDASFSHFVDCDKSLPRLAYRCGVPLVTPHFVKETIWLVRFEDYR